MKQAITAILLLLGGTLFSQTINDYTVHLKPRKLPEMMGIQSFAFGQHDGKWVIIGGRLDGLHRRQPFAAFDSIGHNNRIIVIDPVREKVWKASVDALPDALKNQLKATNTCFVQEGERLYIAGGYGIEKSENDHRTFPFLTEVALPDLITAVQNGNLPKELFRQQEDTLFAVTGGQLMYMDNVFYLTGGHRFDGRYNPADRPTFTQAYTNAVRRFTIDSIGQVQWMPALENEQLMHRRDFNVTMQQTADGTPYFTAFSGVFQKEADLPFLSAVHVNANGMSEQHNFRQYYNHYHCPEIPLFDKEHGEMHTLFFGGIAQYYDSLGTLLQDDNVPFVTTISRVTRYADGSMKEYKLPAEMPALLGAAGEFIPHPDLPRTIAGIPAPNLHNDSILLGTLVGGIASTARNIFWINNEDESAAFSGMFDVYLVKSREPHKYNAMSNSQCYLHVRRNTEKERYQVVFTLARSSEVTILWSDEKGKVRHSKTFTAAAGKNVYGKLLPKKPGYCSIELRINNRPEEGEKLYFSIPEE